MTRPVVCQPLSKLGMSTCVCFTYNAFHNTLLVKGVGRPDVRGFVGKIQRDDNFPMGKPKYEAMKFKVGLPPSKKKLFYLLQ